MPTREERIRDLEKENLEEVFQNTQWTLSLLNDMADAFGDSDIVIDKDSWYAISRMTRKAKQGLDRAFDALPGDIICTTLEDWTPTNTPERAEQLRQEADHVKHNHRKGYGPKPPVQPTVGGAS